MIEKIITFGKDRSLVGVLSPSEGRPDAPCVLLLNAGLVHRVGPYRMNVDLARLAASLGLDAFRFDQSGIGDSEAPRDDRSFERRAIDDAIAAMDKLAATRGKQRFILIGLCSGAVNAHQIAAADPRVCGAVFLDGYAYRTPAFYVRHVARRAVSPVHWMALARRVSTLVQGGARAAAAPEPGDEREQIFEQVSPPKAEVEQDLLAFAERRLRMLFIYTSGAETLYNGDGQFFESFPQPSLRELVEIVRYPLYDHTFTLLGTRKELLARISAWLRQHFAARVE